MRMFHTSSKRFHDSAVPRPATDGRPWNAGRRKRLLVLTTRFPFPPRSGVNTRLLHTARALAADCDLTLLALSPRPIQIDQHQSVSPFSRTEVVVLPRWRSCLQALAAIPTANPLQFAYYRSKLFRDAVEKLLPEHDGVVAHLQRAGQYVQDLSAAKPVVLDMTDAISLNYKRVVTNPGLHWSKLLYGLEQRRLERAERTAWLNFSETWLVSSVDVQYLFEDAVPSSVACVPLPVDLAEFPYKPSVGGKTILFIGNMAYGPNRDACIWFCQEVLPVLRLRLGDIRFRIVGPIRNKLRNVLSAFPGVEVVGEVQRIPEHVNDVFCGVCPMRIGAGMQNKVLNYLALGVPCVTSDLGLEGIDARDGEDLLCFRTAKEAIEKIVLLAQSPVLSQQLQVRGLAVAQSYSTESLYPYMRQRAKAIFALEPPHAEETQGPSLPQGLHQVLSGSSA